jgi:hypothetical protein
LLHVTPNFHEEITTPMSQISAADNIIIEANPQLWQMRVNTNFVDHVQGDGLIMEATQGNPLRYTTAFARTRRLPKGGNLSTRYIQRVVLGWSWDDEAWHLGLLLTDTLATIRGSRWCEIARWPDPDNDLYREIALGAGQTLAQALDRPFNLIPIQKPPDVTQPTPVPLPKLPLDLQDWRFGRQGKQNWLVFIRDKSWAREHMRRMIWYGAWSVVYLVLSVATLLADIARPRPAFLPYLGIATSVLLVGLVFYSWFQLRRKARRVVVDPTTHRVWGLTTPGSKPVWRFSRSEIDSVYISKVVKNHNSRDSDKEKTDQPATADINYGEINLRLTNGSFFPIIAQTEPETVAEAIDGTPDDVTPLESHQVKTRLQAAAIYVAEGLDVPIWFDYREK